MEPNVDLRESVFFTARPRPLPSTTEVSTDCASSSSHSASSSSSFYSARIQSLTERMINQNLSEVDTAIEASKDHWTQVEAIYHTTASNSLSAVDASMSERQSGTQGASSSEMDPGELYEENLEFLRRLQSSEDPVGDFFRDSIDGEFVLGKKIAEGGQADIYESHEYKYAFGERVTLKHLVVLKVFKAGILLVDLRKQWSLALLHKLNPSHPDFCKAGPSDCCNPIWNGWLLGDGRFAFVMGRMWGDLRQLMDLRMRHNGNLRPPFMMADGNHLECCILDIMLDIAMGMRNLHSEDTLHRDLKASNILIYPKGSDFDPVTNLNHNLGCLVADFECSIGVVGTGYWRAPEILEAVKNRTWSTSPNVITTKSDVYSYGMTCYEILTGHVPFEDIEDLGKTSLDDVLEGKRPSLPSYLKAWVKEWLCRCWYMEPLERPSFEEIVDFLVEIDVRDLNCQRESKFYTFHDYGFSSSENEED